ncbi:COG4223 family protein [Rhizobium alvei]|uniref:Mitofilin family membrane protein n=1 Tax=Rhizobium alvei TaxID=1132659 RepID=A0ABT8YME5_9HYPH|nr:mitofilin family membrane protein [Rhizobium alvei]MDO6964888.1 mitofilin family membrane protein [Rhizobium alvei]
MEPADPTRHSKTRPEPVTIDLAAEEVKDSPASEAEGTEEDVTASNSGEAESVVTPAEPPSEQPRSPAAENVSVKSGHGSLSLVAAGLIGGLIVLGGAASLQYWGVLPALGRDDADAKLMAMTADVESLRAQLSTLASAKPEVDLGPINEKLATLEKKAADMPLANGLSADADARISAIAQQVTDTAARIDSGFEKAETARAALELKLEALEKKVNAPRDDVAVAVAIAAAGLKAAIDRGGPFLAELDTLAGISPDDPVVKELQTYAAVGVPSRSQLIGQFPTVADTILASLVEEDPNQSLTDRLMESAFSAIKVRPVGNVEGEGPGSVVARMERKLQDGDLKGAALEWDTLPEKGKAASSSYKKSLDARIKVEELVGSTLSRAVSKTGNAG